jgi:tetratricopeptide (TPR) repeat protein
MAASFLCWCLLMHHRFRIRMGRLVTTLVAGMCAALLAPSPAQAQNDLEHARQLFRQGRHEDALKIATEATRGNVYFDGWHLLKADIELTLGRWQDARATLEQALQRHTWSIQLRWLAREAYRRTGDDKAAERMQVEILRLAEASPWRFTDPRNLVVLGEVALDMGADAKEVLEAFFERAEKSNAGAREPVKAIGNLALSKNDFKLAASTFRGGLKQFEDDPDLLFGLAAALRGSDPPQAQKLIEQALKVNPRHIPSLLLIADRQIDSEDYEAAQQTLQQVLEVNPEQDEALALLAAIAHLTNDVEQEQEYREKALSSWATNPRVDHLIGRELSQKYRFREGVEYQWRALDFDVSYLPARRQAAQDLLRLGEEEQGWQMAAGVFKDDAYDVTAYNLVTLRDELEQFTTLQDESFVLRMETKEAAIYGQRVLDLLHRAKSTLCEKYGLDLREPVIVEIFPNPADFEVRTFGMPGIPGFLGVCFGRVITANSPARQAASPSNWEAVLWHEFCHVVTLTLTRNRMPRWLSEGISVYEERQADPRWGQSMTPAYRKRILEGGLLPISELSSGFMSPGEDIQFAYYESSLVVEFIIDEYGLEALKAVLADLAEGLPINEALPRHTIDMPALEADFEAFAREQAEALAPGADWSEPDIAGLLADDNSEALLREWVAEHPTNIRGKMVFALLLIENERWEEAIRVLREVIDLHPGYIERQNPYVQLAQIHRRQGNTQAEAEVLEELAARAADAGQAYLRLIDLAHERDDAEALARNAERLIAVNPLTQHPHTALASASESLGMPQQAVSALRSLLHLEPDDPALLHYRLARNLNEVDEQPQARRHVLMALENAPRYRDAQRLLLRLAGDAAAADEPLLPELADEPPARNRKGVDPPEEPAADKTEATPDTPAGSEP